MDAAALDRLLADDFLAGIGQLPMETLRSRRAECQEVEVSLSYVRRLVHARLDLIAAELTRRVGDTAHGDLGELVEQLKRGEIIGDKLRSPGVGRLPTLMAPGDEETETPELDDIFEPSQIHELSDDELRESVERLRDFEQGMSARRQQLHRQIDALHEELVRRYRDGEETVESLLR